MEDLQRLNRELMAQAEKDLGMRLDWVGVDHLEHRQSACPCHWRGRADDGQDLVIDRDYIRSGFRVPDIEAAGDSAPGSIVELRSFEDAKGARRVALAVRSALSLEAQIKADGATWLDRKLIARDPVELGGGFGIDVSHLSEHPSVKSPGLYTLTRDHFQRLGDVLPSFASLADPQHGQFAGAAMTTRSRGRCSGKGLRDGKLGRFRLSGPPSAGRRNSIRHWS
ncbi:hypothetical protein NXT3_PB00347 (plasmid) [Sinorhizobium fredii]|uniref:Uncharacterized protein n=1 Tax=Rhizobium fredii TaxID=380 RepID=A0A2L0HCV4_RHIFR|nr:hypothetical protein NXT3_PB00347 [Sinorhizobium fredii]